MTRFQDIANSPRDHAFNVKRYRDWSAHDVHVNSPITSAIVPVPTTPALLLRLLLENSVIIGEMGAGVGSAERSSEFAIVMKIFGWLLLLSAIPWRQRSPRNGCVVRDPFFCVMFWKGYYNIRYCTPILDHMYRSALTMYTILMNLLCYLPLNGRVLFSVCCTWYFIVPMNVSSDAFLERASSGRRCSLNKPQSTHVIMKQQFQISDAIY